MGSMIQCTRCKTVLHSMFRHDFQGCKCEEHHVCVDGGFDYGRFVGEPQYMKHIAHTHPNKSDRFEVALLLVDKESKNGDS